MNLTAWVRLQLCLLNSISSLTQLSWPPEPSLLEMVRFAALSLRGRYRRSEPFTRSSCLRNESLSQVLFRIKICHDSQTPRPFAALRSKFQNIGKILFKLHVAIATLSPCNSSKTDTFRSTSSPSLLDDVIRGRRIQ